MLDRSKYPRMLKKGDVLSNVLNWSDTIMVARDVVLSDWKQSFGVINTSGEYGSRIGSFWEDASPEAIIDFHLRSKGVL